MADLKLADLNVQLIAQNKTLDKVESGVDKLNQNLTKYLDVQKADRLRQLEADREARAKSRSERRDAANTAKEDRKTALELDKLNGALKTLATIAAGKSVLGAVGSAIPGGAKATTTGVKAGSQGLGAGFKGLLGGLTLATLGPELLRGLAKRGPFLLANLFADQIATGAEEMFKSKELGDAIFMGLKLGGLAGLVSPKLGIRFGLIGALGSIAMSDENLAKLKEIREGLPDFSDTFNSFSERLNTIFGFEIPKINLTLKDVTSAIQNTVGKALDAVIDFQKNGFDGETFQKNWDAVITTLGGLAFAFSPLGTFKLLFKVVKRLGLALLGLNTAAAGLNATVLGPAAAQASTTAAAASATALKDMSRDQLFKNAKNLSAKELKAAGIDKIGDRLVKTGTSEIVSNEMLRNALEKSAGGKLGGFPRAAKFFKFLRGMGPLGAMLGAYDIYSIMSGPGSTSQKIPLIAGAMTGLLGTAAGSGIGAWAGTMAFPGIGTAIGAAGGGLLGFFGANTLGTALAQWMMGQPINAFPFDWMNNLANNNSSDVAAVAGQPNGQIAPAQPPTSGQALTGEAAIQQRNFQEINADIRRAMTQLGGLPIGGGQTVNNVVSAPTAQAIITNGAGTIDKLADFDRK